MSTWQLQTAKAKLSELLRAVRDEGPQVISVRGKEEYVIMRKDASQTQAAKPTPKTWDELFDPVRGLGDDLEEALKGVREDRMPYDSEER